MQVSWIDPEELNSLARQLLDPPAPGSQQQEVQPLPDTSILGSESLVDASPPQTNPSPLPELEQIRAKLRSIRDRAKSAGLLPTSPPSPAPSVTGQTSPITSAASPPARPATNPNFSSSLASIAFPAATPSSNPSLPIPSPQTVTAHTTFQEAISAPKNPTQADHDKEPPLPSFHPAEGTIADRLHAFGQWATEQTQSDDFLVLDHHGDILWGVPSSDDLLIHSILIINRRQNEKASPHAQGILHSHTSKGKCLTIIPTTTRYGEVNIVTHAAKPPSESTLLTLRDSLSRTIDHARFP